MPRLPSTDRSATTIRLELTLKRRASMWALRHGVNLSDAIEQGLRLLLAQPSKRPAMSPEEREKAKAWFRERRAAKGKAPVPPAPSLPLDAPAGGQVKGEPDPAPQPVQPERQPVQHELERQG